MPSPAQGHIAVIGAGTMGRGIAEAVAAAGLSVTVIERSQQALAKAKTATQQSLDGLQARGKITPEQARATFNRMSWSNTLPPVAPCDLVIEAIVENLDLKIALLNEIEALVRHDAVLATNTSSFSITSMAQQLKGPERFAGLHFFNPATLMKLIEIVPSSQTNAETLSYLKAVVTEIKKTGVVVQDVPGFIVNRVARPYYAEGFRAFSDGIPNSSIDHVFRVNGGFRMGPLELGDLIGHDINYTVAKSVYDAYHGKTRFTPQVSQAQLVAAGSLGKKTGRGFYDYSAPLPQPIFLTEDTSQTITAPENLNNFVLELDGVHVQSHDGRSAGRVAAEVGKPVALIDWSRDSVKAESLSISVSVKDQDRALGAARRLAFSAGKKAIHIADRPGGLVLRGICQLANAAADAADDRIAEPEAIDEAMVLGANHPAGPLATIEGFGAHRAVKALSAIAEETDEAMYNPSEFLRHLAGRTQ